MRKIIFVSLLIALLGLAFANVPSVAGKRDGTAHYNYAHLDIALKMDFPDQVSFELPQVAFNLDFSKVGPGTLVNVNILITNTSDRAITVEDTVLSTISRGFVPQGPVDIAAGGQAYFTYTLTTPADQDIFDAFVQAIMNGAADEDGVSYFNPDNGIFTIWTSLQAKGIQDAASPQDYTFD